MNTLATLIKAQARYSEDQFLQSMGEEMFKMYTQNGFPPDMFLSELSKRVKLPKLAKVFIVSEYQTRQMEHKRRSGVYEKNLDKVRQQNVKVIENLITKGETGIY